MSLWHLLRANLRRAPARSLAAGVASAVGAGALFAVLVLMTGMQRLVAANLDRLGADLLLVPRGGAAAVAPLLSQGEALPLAPSIPVATWRQRLADGKVVGIQKVEGLDLSQGGTGRPAGEMASVLLIYLERWAAPMIAYQEVSKALPEAEAIVAEQATRQVTRNLQPVVRFLGVGAVVALLGGVIITGLLTAIRVSERRGELGMMRAMGARRSFLVALMLAESGLTALGGALAGVVLAGVLLPATAFSAGLVRLLHIGELVGVGVGVMLAATLAAVLAALGPALRAGRLDPLDAIRRGR